MFALAGPGLSAGMFAAIAAARWQATIAVSSPSFTSNARVLARLAASHRMPAMFDTPAFVKAGALMTYGPDLPAAFRRAAELVSCAARGAQFADMPIEQATKFRLAFNRPAAVSLGLTPSELLMASVDDLIA